MLPPWTNKEKGKVNVKFWQIIQAALFWQWSQKMFACYQGKKRWPSFTGLVLESSSLPSRLFIFLSALSLFSSSNQLPSMAPAAGRAIQTQLNVIISTFALVFFITSYQRRWGICVDHRICLFFFLSLSLALSRPTSERGEIARK